MANQTEQDDEARATDEPMPDTHPGKPEGTGFRIRVSRELWIRLAIAVAIVIVSLFTNRSFLIWGLIASLAVIAVPTGRARSFVAAVVPYAMVWFVFTFLRSLADETILAQTLNTKVLEFERWLFGGELPTIRLQARFYTPGEIAWWDYYFTFIHWSYFIAPHAVILYIWWKDKRQFQHYLGALTLLLMTGLLIYFIIPTNPPWMAPESIDSPGAPVVLRIMEPIANELGGGLYQAGYKIVGESNPIAAMPSIHFAVTFLFVWAARGKSRVWETIAWLYAFSMGLALVYMGEHYIVDIIVGGLVTTYSWFAVGAWMQRNDRLISPTHFGPPTEEAEPVSPDSPRAASAQG